MEKSLLPLCFRFGFFFSFFFFQKCSENTFSSIWQTLVIFKCKCVERLGICLRAQPVDSVHSGEWSIDPYSISAPLACWCKMNKRRAELTAGMCALRTTARARQCFHSPGYRANGRKAAVFDKGVRGRTGALLMLYDLDIFVIWQKGKCKPPAPSPKTMITLNTAWNSWLKWIRAVNEKSGKGKGSGRSSRRGWRELGVVGGVGGRGRVSGAIHLSSLMRSESCTNTDIENIPKNTALLFSPLHFHPVWCLSVSHLYKPPVMPLTHLLFPRARRQMPQPQSLSASVFIWPMLHSFRMNRMDPVWRRERKGRANKGGDHSVCSICKRHHRWAVATTSECPGCAST